MANTPSQTLSGEDAAKIRTAALEAIKSIQGATLGEGEINNILSQIGTSRSSIAEKMTLAASMATTIAEQEKNKPANFASGSPDEINRDRVARGLLPLGLQGAYGSMAMRGGSGDGSGGSRYSELGSRSGSLPSDVSAATLAAYGHQYSGMGFGKDTIGTFASVGLERQQFDGFRHEGFTRDQIKRSANDTRALGWRGHEDNDVAMHAPGDLRGAAAAVERAKTPAARAAAQKHYEEKRQHYESLPDSDPRKQGAGRFINHLMKKNKKFSPTPGTAPKDAELENQHKASQETASVSTQGVAKIATADAVKKQEVAEADLAADLGFSETKPVTKTAATPAAPTAKAASTGAAAPTKPKSVKIAAKAAPSPSQG